MASSTGTPVLVSLCSTSSSAPELSGALPGNTSTAVISWVSGSTTIATLCPSNRLLLLCGHGVRVMRRHHTVPAHPVVEAHSVSVSSTSLSSNCPSNSAAATIC